MQCMKKRGSIYIPSVDDKFDAKVMKWFNNTPFDVLHIDSKGHSATYTLWLPNSNEIIIARVFSLGDRVEISIDGEYAIIS